MKNNSHPSAIGDRYVFGSQRNKAIVTYDGCDVNGIHHTGGIFQHGGKMLTVDEANRKWQEYQAEGNSKANELTTLIANAKATIREQYPDEV